MLKDYLFCRIKDCDFRIGVDINATSEKCDEVIAAFKEHLKSHPLDDVIDTLFGHIMMLRGESLAFRKDCSKCGGLEATRK